MSRSIRVSALVLSFLIVAMTAAAQSADLFLTKSGPASANVGDNVTYTVTIGNNGPNDASSASMTDTLPSGGTFVSEAQTSGPTFSCSTPAVGASGGTVTCTLATFPTGSSATFQITINVSAGSAGTTLVNSATVSSATTDDNPENNASSAGTSISGGNLADVGVSKSAPTFAAPGSNVTFTIVVSDFGPNDASSVTLNDTLGAGLTFVSLTQTGGPTFSCPGSTTPCTIATLPNGSSATFQLVATISSTPGTYSNTATVTSANDPNPDNDAATASVTASSADVGIVKSASATVIAGATLTYTVTVSNGGPGAASSVQFSDPLPPGTTFSSVAQTSGPSGTCTTPAVGFNGTVTCGIGSLLNGESSTFQINVKVDPSLANGTTLSNTATATSGTADTNPNNNTSTATTTVSSQTDLSITKVGPATVTAGSAVTYTITVANNGPSTAFSTSWTDTLPAGMTFVSETQTSGAAFNCTTGATITCTNASMLPGTATFSVTANLSPSATGTVSNTATASTTTPDSNPANNSSTSTATVAQSADLGVTKGGPASVGVGGTISWTIVVNNAGPSDATSVSLTDTLPLNTTFVSMMQTTGPAFVCSGTSTVTCTAATFASGASASFTLTATVNGTGNVANTATVTSATSDPNPANNSATATANATITADLAVTKTGPSSIPNGANITYTITVTNNGPSQGSSITLSDTLPVNESFVSMTQTSGPAFSCSGTTTVTCTAATLNSGASAVFSLVATVTGGTTVSNTATVSSPVADPNTANNQSTSTASVTPSADVAVTKVGPLATSTGANINYTITVTNNGPSDATNVTLTDTLPANTTFVSMTQTSGPPFNCTGTTTVTCTGASLLNGAAAAFTLTVKTGAGLTVTNTATVSAATADPNPANNSSTAVTPVSFGAGIPALSPLALALLGLALAAAAMIALRR